MQAKVGVSEEHEFLQEVKLEFPRKYEHLKRRGDSLILETKKGETNVNGRTVKPKMEWIILLSNGKMKYILLMIIF